MSPIILARRASECIVFGQMGVFLKPIFSHMLDEECTRLRVGLVSSLRSQREKMAQMPWCQIFLLEFR